MYARNEVESPTVQSGGASSRFPRESMHCKPGAGYRSNAPPDTDLEIAL
jgi:hypothetical protein